MNCHTSGSHYFLVTFSSLHLAGLLKDTRSIPQYPTVNKRFSAVEAHAQKPDFFLRRNGRVHLNQRWRQFSRLLAAEVCASAVVMLATPCSEVV